MSLNDPLAAVLSNIMNYERNGKHEVYTKNNSKIIKAILTLLQNHRYLGSFEEIPDGKVNILKISLIGNINKIGVIKPRFSVKKDNYVKFEKRFLPAKGFGILIITTPKGVMTHDEAKKKGLGGKLICYCY